MKDLKQINQKLDTLLERVIVIESLLIRMKTGNIPHKTMREQADETADEHYWDPTKYPTVEDSDTVIGESNEHFKS